MRILTPVIVLAALLAGLHFPIAGSFPAGPMLEPVDGLWSQQLGAAQVAGLEPSQCDVGVDDHISRGVSGQETPQGQFLMVGSCLVAIFVGRNLLNVKHPHKWWFVVDEKLAEADDFGVAAATIPMKLLAEKIHQPFGVGGLALKGLIQSSNRHHSLELLVDVLGESHCRDCRCC